MLGEALKLTTAADEVEVRIVRRTTLGLALAIIAMTVITTLIIDNGTHKLQELSRLSYLSGQRGVLYEAATAWVEAAVVVNQHQELNMTLGDAEGMLGTVVDLQQYMRRDARRFQDTHEALYRNTMPEASAARAWSSEVPHVFVELRLEDVPPAYYEAYGESVGDVVEVFIKEGLVEAPADEDLPDLPERMQADDVTSKLRSNYRLAQRVQAVAPEIQFLPMPLTEMAEHTSNTIARIAAMDPSLIRRGQREVEDYFSNEDAMSGATTAATALYEKAFLKQFQVLQQQVLYTGLGFIGATIVLCGLFYTYSVRSLGYRTWLLLRAVLMVPRKIARIIRQEA